MDREYSVDKLRLAIQIMRDACEEAERELRRDDSHEIELANRVNHAFAWGMANASMEIEICLASFLRRLQMEEAKRSNS